MQLLQLETPALVADGAIVEKNMRTMTAILAGKSLRLRPHYKSHKCAALAKRQIGQGAAGMTCAKLSEAEDLIDAGIEDVLIANQIVEPRKIRRLAELAGLCRLTVCTDSTDNARALSAAAVQAGTTLHVLVEYEIGMERCGLADQEEYVALAQCVSDLPGLAYEGIQAYAGHVSHMVSEAERAAYTDAAEVKIRALIGKLEKAGLKVNTVSGGSTGTAALKAARGLYTELQAGSYFFLDATYRQLENLPFENSLYLLTTIVSRSEGRIVTDAGVKSLGVDQGDPLILTADRRLLRPEKVELHEEHLKIFGLKEELKVGDKLLLIPGHCCSTVNLHDKIYLFRDGKVTERLSVSARGCSR